MSLITCSECGKEISDKATTCPNCGAPTELGDRIADAESRQILSDGYEVKLAIFKRKITRLVVISLCLGMMFLFIGSLVPTIKGKFFTFVAWIITILILYKWVIKENRSLIISLGKVILAAMGLYIILGATLVVGGLVAGTVGAVIVGIIWVIGIIVFLLYPVFDIIKDVKELKKYKELTK